MTDIKKSVGDGADNQVHDVALVQAMLVVVKNAKGAAYFPGPYTGKFDAATKTAIGAFQKDHKLIAPDNFKPDPANPAKFDKASFIAAGSATFKQLVGALPADYSGIRIIENTRTVYLPMDAKVAQANAAKIQNSPELANPFRASVAKLVETMYDRHKIALTIPGDGWRRDFAAQAKIPAGNTGAGPGESNHQFGQAVDIGFQGLQWIDGDGRIRKDNFWLDSASMPEVKKMELWNARNAIAFQECSLFKTNKKGDLIHVQAFDDGLVNYRRSLAKLLQAATVKNMKWTAVVGGYTSDFGLGGQQYAVGGARDVWGGVAKVKGAELAAALNAKLKADKNFSAEKFFGLPPAKAAAPPAAKPAPPQALKEQDVNKYLNPLQKMLKAEFEAADQQWKQWKAVP